MYHLKLPFWASKYQQTSMISKYQLHFHKLNIMICGKLFLNPEANKFCLKHCTILFDAKLRSQQSISSFGYHVQDFLVDF